MRKSVVDPHHQTSGNGFSLMELLVVLILLGFMAGVTAPSIGRFLDGIKIKKQTSKVMAAFRYGRLKSITSGKAVRISLSEDEEATLLYSGGVVGSRSFDLGGDDLLELDPPEIIFYPEGQVSPGTIVLTIGERQSTFILDPLTGLTLLQ